MKLLLLILFLPLAAFGQAYTFADQAWVGNAIPAAVGGGGGGGSTLTNNMTYLYKMEEASGTRNDHLGGTGLGVTATLFQTNAMSGYGVEAQAGGLLTANSEAKFQYGDTDWTFALWLKMNLTNSTKNIFCKYEAGKGEVEVVYNTGNGLLLQVYTNFTGSSSTVAIRPQMIQGQWTFVAASWIAAEDKLFYVVGVTNELYATITNTFAQPINYATNGGLGVLGRYGASGIVSGHVDELAKWSRCLTAQEITNYWKAGTNGTTYPYTGF